MYVDEVLWCGVNVGFFLQFMFGGLQQCFIGFEMVCWLVLQCFVVNGFFDDEKFILGVNYVGNGDMRFKYCFFFLVIWFCVSCCWLVC